MTLPVIMFSSTLPRRELAWHPWLHLDAMICKPFHITEFTDIVEKVLRKTQSAELFRDCALRALGVLLPAEMDAAAIDRSPINPFRRILVVDDDPDARRLHVDLLTGSDYQAEGATDGAAGWEALQTHHYNLVITDNKMPRMTGVEMIQKLRSASINVPVIMATGNVPVHEFARRPWLKPEVMLEKPYTDEDLMVAVKKVLHPDG
jgi:DNA-binding response OmpR family regulator